mmetsp:Transcript_24094/g.58193  ORF Transcript_24094/g.58193 Transcript_24094/m.58193 type:complete len:335 (-) Transcript_24094:18-1022(-)
MLERLERLQFSIPISVAIEAPIDVVWAAVKDIQSYPTTYSSVEKVRPNEDRYCSNVRSSATSGAASSSNGDRRSSGGGSLKSVDDSSQRGASVVAFQGSKWKITRISVLESQRYSTDVTVTQISEEGNRRSFTMSTHQMLGATCSLKTIVEAAQDNDEAPSPSGAQTCRVTVIMTMIPYRFFVKLLGITCCLCLLKSRARMAMERDLEDLEAFCEDGEAKKRSATTDQEEDGRMRQFGSGQDARVVVDDGDEEERKSDNDEENQQEQYSVQQKPIRRSSSSDEDAGGEGFSMASDTVSGGRESDHRRNNNSNLRTILEEDCDRIEQEKKNSKLG